MRTKHLSDVGITSGFPTLAKLLTSLSSGPFLRIIQLRGEGNMVNAQLLFLSCSHTVDKACELTHVGAELYARLAQVVVHHVANDGGNILGPSLEQASRLLSTGRCPVTVYLSRLLLLDYPPPP